MSVCKHYRKVDAKSDTERTDEERERERERARSWGENERCTNESVLEWRCPEDKCEHVYYGISLVKIPLHKACIWFYHSIEGWIGNLLRQLSDRDR